MQERFERNILIAGFGEEGQARLARSRVLVVGLGGLGSPAALYLAAAGVGTLGLQDDDTVTQSNLQRQILHATADLGRPKTESAAEAVAALDPAIKLELLQERITVDNAVARVAGFDAVIEATDNFQTKFILNDACIALDKPLATAGILGLSGHAMLVKRGATACLRCVMPNEPVNPPTTAERGVLGPVPGIMGSIEALEIIRVLAGMWRPPAQPAALLHSLDGDRMRFKTTVIPRRPECACAME